MPSLGYHGKATGLGRRGVCVRDSLSQKPRLAKGETSNLTKGRQADPRALALPVTALFLILCLVSCLMFFTCPILCASRSLASNLLQLRQATYSLIHIVAALLSNLKVFSKVVGLKLVVLLLESFSLISINLGDLSDFSSASLQVANSGGEEVLELELIGITEHVVEAGYLDLSSLSLELKVFNFVKESKECKINLSSFAEIPWPFEKGCKGRNIAISFSFLEVASLLFEWLGTVVNEVQRDGGGLILWHLRDKLRVVSKEKFYIDWSGIRLVTEERNKDLEDISQVFRWLVL